MTRYTNAGRKRTYLEASFDGDAKTESLEPTSVVAEPGQRRRDASGKQGKSAKKAKRVRVPEGDLERKQSAETRRLRRIDAKQSETICFACREKGHAARNCPKANSSALEDDGLPQENPSVGVCYRCGSQRHSLSRCKMPGNPKNPLPYASCFVCTQKGHLASGCPKNAGRGIYPNGGCCKLCGQTDHLAKNCQLRKSEPSQDPIYFGGDHAGGADEDDFHTLKRRRADVEQEEKTEQHRAGTTKKGSKSCTRPVPRQRYPCQASC